MVRALALALLLAACGGGGSTPHQTSGIITPAVALRTDLLFGYYGMNAMAVTESADHTNLVWAAPFYGQLEQMAALTQAKGLGQKAVLMLPPNLYDLPIAETRFYLQRLADAGLLWNDLVALYPIDEPNTAAGGNRTDAAVRARNAELRALMAEYPALSGKALWVIYACKGAYPGASSYDGVGCDDYDSGCAVFDRYYQGLREQAPRARELDVPGGADPWRQDPACFEAEAHRNSNIVALVPFIWQTTTDGATYRGIRENGLRKLYCDAGRKIKGNLQPC